MTEERYLAALDELAQALGINGEGLRQRYPDIASGRKLLAGLRGVFANPEINVALRKLETVTGKTDGVSLHVHGLLCNND